MSDDRQERERRQAEIWQQIEKYRQELRGADGSTMQSLDRVSFINERIETLEAEYVRQGGILHERPGKD